MSIARRRDPALPFVDDYLPALLARASHLISSEFHRVVLAQGLSVTEWRVLASLAGSGAVSTGELARLSITTQPTVTRVIDGLQARGAVVRVADARDRRVTRVHITDAGARCVADLMAQARAHESAVLAPLGADQAATIKHALLQLIALHQPGAAAEAA